MQGGEEAEFKGRKNAKAVEGVTLRCRRGEKRETCKRERLCDGSIVLKQVKEEW